MNLLLLKQITLISIFAGAILGFITIVPYLSFLSFMVLILFLSALVIVYLKRNDLIGIISVREGCIFGALIGFVSFIGFSIVYTPLSMLMGWLFPSYTQGFLRFFLTSFGSFVVMVFTSCSKLILVQEPEMRVLGGKTLIEAQVLGRYRQIDESAYQISTLSSEQDLNLIICSKVFQFASL